jgi:hypothetical protein
MVVFAVAARMIAKFLPDGWEPGVLCMMEVSGGSAALAAAPLSRASRLILLAAACGFGGLAIMAQNLRRLPGVKWQWYLSGKTLHGALCAGLCWAQLGLKFPAPPPMKFGWEGGAVAACIMVLLTFAGVYFARRTWYNAGIRKKG